jgi:hypothetical protein
LGLKILSFGKALHSGQESLFTTGFAESSADPALVEKLRGAGLVEQCMRNSEHLQLNIEAQQEIAEHVAAAGLTEDLAAIEQLFEEGRLSDEEISAEALMRVPQLSEFEPIWNSNIDGINNVNLTSVGIALGHAYWSRLSGQDAPLSIWL